MREETPSANCLLRFENNIFNYEKIILKLQNQFILDFRVYYCVNII